jgi:cell wall-associated NlpC family hydrolase
VEKLFKKFKKTIATGVVAIMFAAFPGVGSVSLAAEVKPLVLKQGMNGEDVIRLQTKLLNYGYYHGVADGNFGDETKTAVIYFQQDAGLLPDGVVGEHTWRALRNYLSPASRGAVSRNGQQIADFAMQYLGTTYVWGGASPRGFDCSGFMFYVLQQHGVTVPRMADGQFDVGKKIAAPDLSAGDLVFFTTYEPGPSHVGIYLGDGTFIHASSAAGKVTITPLSRPYYRERYLGARRHLN